MTTKNKKGDSLRAAQEKAATLEKPRAVVIRAPNFGYLAVPIIGISPLCINRFGARARDAMRETQEAGSKSKNKRKHEPKDFDALFRDAAHVSSEGWYGIHAAAFRNACISACRVAGFVMTKAKLSIFTEPEGFDRDDGTPLVKIVSGEPENWIGAVRLENGVMDLRPRPLWRKWGALPKIRFDADQFTEQDIINLMMRVGLQVGVGEGRPDSKSSPGLGYGLFSIADNLQQFEKFAKAVAA